jgi:hypothetical protein
MPNFLWRLEGSCGEPNAAAWQQGLTLHLLFQPLTTVLVRRDNVTRCYLVLAGCPSCRPDGCERLCHRMLFAQLVRTTLPGVELIPVSRLAHSPDETQQIVATPRGAQVQLLDAAFLAQWREGRLITTWSRLRASARPVVVGAMLAVGAEGPAPARALRSAGWQALPIASLAARRVFQTHLPAPVPVGTRADEALFASLRDPGVLLGAASRPEEANA